MKILCAHRVDAFSEEEFGGNPAAVVLEAEDLSEEEMIKVAKEVSCKETAFLLPAEHADFRLRFFTQRGDEIKFCGHATVGVLYLIAREQLFGIAGPGSYLFNVETKADDLCMSVEFHTLDDIRIKFDCPHVDLIEAPFKHTKLADALGINVAHFDQSKPIMLERTNNYLYACVQSLDDLGSIVYNVEAASEFAKENNFVVYCLMTNETFNPDNSVHTRCFGPSVGVVEDAFSGSVQGGLVAFMYMYDMILEDHETIGSEQGHFMHRPGHAHIHVERENGHPKIIVDATARHVMCTTITIDD